MKKALTQLEYASQILIFIEDNHRCYNVHLKAGLEFPKIWKNLHNRQDLTIQNLFSEISIFKVVYVQTDIYSEKFIFRPAYI